jgi:rRNA-processing protein FCF1
VSDRPIRIVLDTSAILEFARESLNVGEVIAEVDDEKAAFGLPALCLVEANRAAAEDGRIELLLSHPACRRASGPS